MTRLEPATPRDIPGAILLLAGAGIAALGAAAHAVGDGLERIAVALVVRMGIKRSKERADARK